MVASAAAAAPRGPELASLRISLWPEYDRPAVLATYTAVLAPDVPLPATVSLPIPTRAGEPHAVAKRGADGGLYDAEHTSTVEGSWTWLHIVTDTSGVHVEYYDPIERSGASRRYALEWPGSVAVGDLTYSIQVPPDATDVQVGPQGAAVRVRGGLSYHEGSLGRVEVDGSATLTLAYTKPNDTLTVAALNAAPQVPPPSSQAPPPSPAASRSAPPPASEPSSDGATRVFDLVGAVVVAGVVGYLLGRRTERRRASRDA